MEKTLAEVNAEIGVLQEAKESCERAFEAKALPHDVVTENLSIRESRREFEVGFQKSDYDLSTYHFICLMQSFMLWLSIKQGYALKNWVDESIPQKNQLQSVSPIIATEVRTKESFDSSIKANF